MMDYCVEVYSAWAVMGVVRVCAAVYHLNSPRA